MEPFLADLINNPKVPKPIRYGIVIILNTFIIAIGILCFLKSPFLWGKVFGIILAIVFLGVGIYLCVKISKNES